MDPDHGTDVLSYMSSETDVRHAIIYDSDGDPFGLVVAIAYAMRNRRERNRARALLVQELEEELQTAHDMA